MKTERITLKGIPALLIGEPSHKVYLYVHGKMGSKEEALAFAEQACPAGYQVLAIDLPEHGERKNGPERLLPWVVVPELQFYGSVCKSALAAGLAAGHEHRCVVFHAGVTGEGTAPCALRFAHRGYGRPHRQDDAAGQRDRRTAEGGRGDPHNFRGDAFVAVSLLGAGASAPLAHPHAGALW